jgi:hypothetical protein
VVESDRVVKFKPKPVYPRRSLNPIHRKCPLLHKTNNNATKMLEVQGFMEPKLKRPMHPNPNKTNETYHKILETKVPSEEN